MRRTLTAACMFLLAASTVLGAEPRKVSPGAVPIQDPPAIHNLYLLSTNVYSGSTPEGDAGFQALANLGVRTIISVDGARPEVDRAKRFGMRYVHLPHGYDGISTNLQLQLAKAAVDLAGPIYVHCHHGKHRGPTAAAIICMTRHSWDAAQAEQWLQAAGTATNYAGLYATVRDFKKPLPQELNAFSTELPEVSKVSGLVESMVQIDNVWEHLKAVRSAQYQAPNDHPDIRPANEAVILWEHYREAQRLEDAKNRGSDFLGRLKAAEDEVKTAEQLLLGFQEKPGAELRAQLDSSFEAIGKSCASCHKKYRDQ